MSLPMNKPPTFFDLEKKIKFFSRCREDDCYTSIFLGILVGTINHCRQLKEETNYRERRLKYLRGKEKALDKELNEFLTLHNLSRESHKNVLNSLVELACQLHGYCFRIFTRTPGQRVYILTHEVNNDSEIIVNLAVFENKVTVFFPTKATIQERICKDCGEKFQRLNRHQCSMTCIKCCQKDCDAGKTMENVKKCDECNFFYTPRCFEGHKKPRNNRSRAKSKCDTIKWCSVCNQVYRIESHRDVHDCNKRKYCNTCKRKVNHEFHNCCWAPISDVAKRKMIEKQENYKFIIFDFESCIIDENTEEFITQWITCVAYSCMCSQCCDIEPFSKEPCVNCGLARSGYIKHQKGEPHSIVIDKFLDLILFDQRCNNSILLSHNGARFDVQFILERLLIRGITPTVINRGTAMIIVEVAGIPGIRNHVTFKDTFLYLSVPLSALPNLFNLEGQRKGYWPLYYLVEKNYGSVLPHLPDKKYYGCKYMSVETREKFEKWHAENYNSTFVFEHELYEYVKNDVYILQLAVAKLVKLSLQLYGLNIVVHCATLPAFAFTILKHKYKAEQVAILPELGMTNGETASKLACRYIQWVEQETGEQYQYALRGGEFKINNWRVDAINHSTGKIIEVLGDLHHANPSLYSPYKLHPLYKGKTMSDVFNESMFRINKIREMGFTVQIVWESSIKIMLKSSRMFNFFETREHLVRMMIRDGYYGGRCGCSKLRVTANWKIGESIEFLDVNALYAYSMARAALFPEGSPIVKTDYPVQEYKHVPFRGFAKVKVLAPKQLLHPVLPYRRKRDKKLIFTLCYKCSEEVNNESCTHTDEERALHIVCYSEELKLAMEEANYKLLHIYESWSWVNWSNTIFREYINPLQKIKMECQGFEREDMTSEEQDTYIEDVFRNEGIRLEKEKIVENKPLRAWSKLMCNAAYGKFAQRSDRSTTEFIHLSSPKLYKRLLDEHIRISSQKVIGQHLMISFRQDSNLIECAPYCNVSYAAIISATSRMILWRAMNKVGEAVCYYDTDSLSWLHKPGEENLESERGPWFGKWSVEHDKAFTIYEMVSAGSKTYAYRMINKETGEIREQVKVKGVTLDSTSKDLVNFDSLCKIVDSYVKEDKEDFITTSRPQILKKDARVYTRQREKKLRVVMDKLRHFPDYSTKPFGYVDVL